MNATGQNGKHTVRFVKTNPSYMNSLAGDVPLAAGSTAYTIAAVWSSNYTNDWGLVWEQMANPITNGKGARLLLQPSTPFMSNFTYNDYNINLTAGQLVGFGKFCAGILVRNGNQIISSRGGNEVTGTMTGTGVLASDWHGVGSIGGGLQDFLD
ncbi:hypothetical protein EBR96_00375, partial [bacterium]|nr:hypothetical protein [bacterium]